MTALHQAAQKAVEALYEAFDFPADVFTRIADDESFPMMVNGRYLRMVCAARAMLKSALQQQPEPAGGVPDLQEALVARIAGWACPLCDGPGYATIPMPTVQETGNEALDARRFRWLEEQFAGMKTSASQRVLDAFGIEFDAAEPLSAAVDTAMLAK